MDKETYQRAQKKRRKGKIKSMCHLCGEDNPEVLSKAESHHIWGRANSDLQVLLCLNCHNKITRKQNKFPPSARSKNASFLENVAYRLGSQGIYLELIGKSNQDIAFDLINYGQDSG